MTCTLIDPASDILQPPADPAQWAAWRDELHRWRTETRRTLHYSDALYQAPPFAWGRHNFACCLMMLCDEMIFRDGAYHVEEFVAHARREWGGFDSVVLWHAYPRIGVDDRNQFDFYREMPGGLEGLRDVSRRFARLGVRVILDYNPWDVGTRRENSDDLTALCALVKELEADGIFLDTLKEGAPEMRRRFDQARPGIILESELALPLEKIHDHHNSWAQWFKDSAVPGVLRNKWFERGHIQHGIHRWDNEHWAELHTAWMNGSGVMIWENVFGTLKPWNARDRSLSRAILPIQRRFHQLFCGENWTPLVETLVPGVYASEWEQNGVRLWTLVNRNEHEVSGPLLSSDVTPGERVFDLVAGHPSPDFAAVLPPRGVGCFLVAAPETLGADWPDFLAFQAQTHARADYRADSPDGDTTPTVASRRALDSPPWTRTDADAAGLLLVDGDERELRSQFTVRECGFYDSRDRHDQSGRFLRRVRVAPFALEASPVTNAQFAAFLRATDYQPQDSVNFLRHWQNGRFDAISDNEPVVYVSLEDARAFARWSKKRLPTEEEWQIGVMDHRLPHGTVWEWTESERSDGRTRFCLLKGGSRYQAQGSHWYADGGSREPDFVSKFLLMAPGIDRCATVGFRCAVCVPS